MYLPRLDILKLSDDHSITDVSLKKLTNLTHLMIYGVSEDEDSAISDDSVSRLANLTELHIGLISTITNKSISFLAMLTELALHSVPTITDKSITNANKSLATHYFGYKFYYR